MAPLPNRLGFASQPFSNHLSLAVFARDSVAAIDHAIAAVPTAVATATATTSAAVAAAFEARKYASPAPGNAACENIDAPWPRAIAAAVYPRAHVTHLLRLRGSVVLRV